MREQNVASVEMKPPKESKRRRITVETEDSLSAPWRLLAGILGILGLGLMVAALALGVLIANQSYEGSERPPSYVNTTSERECYSGSCPENWIWNRGNCYYLSREDKNWSESQTACRSMNSSLLKIDGSKEDFLKLLSSFYWIGLSQNGSDGPWLWEDRSELSQDLLSVKSHFTRGTCVHYGLKNQFSSGNCDYLRYYICEQRAI
ncbi:natural killer cells antigen CD94-like isoform X2 [Ornithorhynchus anatinus]|uniref:natural killer cells antigen CD94-like isoform X2 n=1 Tax=Ornithorhynchus anatinus TaxID=9258 RepID=UPI0010A81C78|nr:natural killer cells antigen CD94-like isoform X2 [Ornithorhynchus anatinus]